jgi:hypothetical protein
MDAFTVAHASAKARMSWAIPVTAINLDDMRRLGYYRRPTTVRGGRLFDVISGAPMATEFAISRFLVPHLAGRDGWALFCDADVMFRCDPHEIFALADSRYAVQVVKHTHMPSDAAMVAAVNAGRPVADGVKMDGQVQSWYAKKNWSSVTLWNLSHPSNRKLNMDLVNGLPGRDLHAFCWLHDSEIGALPRDFNHLVGVDPVNPDARLVHFTEGVPSMRGYENCEHATEWRSWLDREVGGATLADAALRVPR